MVAQRNGSHPSPSERLQRVQALRKQLEAWEGRSSLGTDPHVVRSDCEPFDRLFPAGGALRGTLVEWLSPGKGSGAALLALTIGCRACQGGGMLVVVDSQGWFYPPALRGWNLGWHQLMVLRPADHRTHLWALDQALRCSAVAAVWTTLDRVDSRDFRRLQLAAQQGGSLGLLVRPWRWRDEPSWADVRLAVRPRPHGGEWGLQVEWLGGRVGGRCGRVELELDSIRGAIRSARAAGAASHRLSAS